MVQTTYKYSTPLGQPGGLVDMSWHEIDSFHNENEDGVMKFGMGVVRGTTAGKQVKVPVAASTSATFEGVVVNKPASENQMFDGGPQIRNKATVGVMRYGRIYGLLATGITPAYGDAVYLVKSGDDAGCFTNASGDTAIAIKGRFLGTGADGIAPIELFNQDQA